MGHEPRYAVRDSEAPERAPRGREAWIMEAARVALVLVIAFVAGLLRYGGDVFRLHAVAFQLPAIAFAGALAYSGHRLEGWRWGILIAYVVLIMEYITFGSLGHRQDWPALLWVFVVGLSLIGAIAAFGALRPVMRFGRFVPVSIVVGIGFVLATVLLALFLRLRPIGPSAQINFAVGSLAGAALGLGWEIGDLVFSTPRGRAGIARG